MEPEPEAEYESDSEPEAEPEPEPWRSNPCPLTWTQRSYFCLIEKEEGALELDDKDLHKSLYICTSEIEKDYCSYNVRAIKLSRLFSSEINQLDEVAYEFGQHLPIFAGCGVFGSEIIFAGGSRVREYGLLERDCSKDLYAFDTDDRYYSPEAKKPKTDVDHVKNPKPKPFKKMAASFRQGKHRPLLVELGGKLYSLSGKPIFEPAPTNPAFEIFDAVEGTWSPLAEPPFLVLGDPDFKFAHFSYIVTGTKIFVSNKEVLDPTPRKSFEKPFDCYVFCFDVAHPHKGWRKFSNFFQIKAGCFPVPLPDEMPFLHTWSPFISMTSTPFHGRALALDLDLPNGDELKLVFTYSFGKPTEIQVHVMSYSEETMLYIKSLELTQLPPECNEPTEYNFVYLGGQNVCLILSRFSQNRNMDEDQYSEYEYGIQKISLLVIPFTFTYYLDWTLHVNFKVLSTRILEYYTKENSSEHPEVVGCYVL